MSEFVYGRTSLGQLIYDLGFTKLSDQYLARKHGMPIEKIRTARAAFERGFAQGNAEAKRKRGAKRR
jgi:hypothetical protein